MRPITRCQLTLLAAIAAQSEARGFPPTYRELCGALGIKSTNAIADEVAILRRKGLLKEAPVPRRARPLELTAAAHAALAARRWQFFAVGRGPMLAEKDRVLNA